MPYLNATFGLADSPVKMSPSLEWVQDLGLKGNDLASFMNFLDFLRKHAPEFASSKTFKGFCLRMEGEISKSSYDRWPNSGMLWDGVCLTAKVSESPNHVKESSLWDAIEKGSVPQKYFLSANAAQGMLRRVDRMGRNLFPHLRQALEILAKGR